MSEKPTEGKSPQKKAIKSASRARKAPAKRVRRAPRPPKSVAVSETEIAPPIETSVEEKKQQPEKPSENQRDSQRDDSKDRNQSRGNRNRNSSRNNNHREDRPNLDAKDIAKKAWRIFLAEVSEEGVALIKDKDARELSKRCFKLAEIFAEEEAYRTKDEV